MFDDAAATAAALTNLTHLRPFNNKLTDIGLAKLTQLNRLEYPNVGDIPVTAGGIAAFTQLCPNCEVAT